MKKNIVGSICCYGLSEFYFGLLSLHNGKNDDAVEWILQGTLLLIIAFEINNKLTDKSK